MMCFVEGISVHSSTLHNYTSLIGDEYSGIICIPHRGIGGDFRKNVCRDFCTVAYFHSISSVNNGGDALKMTTKHFFLTADDAR